MAHKGVYTVPYRRKREGKTNYKRRLNLVKSKKDRLVIRITNKHIIAQLIRYYKNGDQVIASAHSSDLEKYGWPFRTNNLPAAYLTGMLVAKKAEGSEANADLGLKDPIHGSRLFAVVKGAIDGGMSIPHSEIAFPDEKRIKGEHIASYAKNPDKEKNVLSSYKEPERIVAIFEEVKNKIMKNGKTKEQK